ncbi:IPT/TIG domain-containing protein [Flagellimonas algicola]|uniref:IPT/TIG domain-containing protein n=1 Tax=Flagellimonas algicola TaxID=2583815 RepID=A0ABY2WGS6_9FLAO|nr:IPT/TIG domain-containing protein [Allomuricauda algicola]TMU50379.1 hypothetical protein FGG15_19925 [Allomuricauda algicola]
MVKLRVKSLVLAFILGLLIWISAPNYGNVDSYGSDGELCCSEKVCCSLEEIEKVGLEPKILSVSPLEGPKLSVVTIIGKNFGKDPEKVEVHFNGTSAKVRVMDDETIVVEVPVRAFTGPITLVVNGFELKGPEFRYVVSETKVSTFVGGYGRGYANGNGTDIRFDAPMDLVRDTKGNLFVLDFYNHAIRKVTPEGQVSTFVGNGAPGDADGMGTRASFYFSEGLAIDNDDNIYVADTGNHSIRKITPSGEVSTIVGGADEFEDHIGRAVELDSPVGIVVGDDNALYVTEIEEHIIRRISLDDLKVSTYAGSRIGFGGDDDGCLETARFRNPYDITMGDNGKMLVTDIGSHRIRSIDQKSGMVTTLAGSVEAGYEDGDRDRVKFRTPSSIAIGKDGTVFISDSENNCIRQMDSNGMVFTIAGTPDTSGYKNGPGNKAQFARPNGILSVGKGEFYLADRDNHAIRKVILM